MKHAKWLVVVTLVMLSGLAVAQTLGSSRIVTEVPFEFAVGNKIVPAGQCDVRAINTDGKVLIIQNAVAKVGLISSTSLQESKEVAAHYALVFKHYGNVYFLSSVKLEGSKVTYQFPESKAEAELRAQNAIAAEETLVAALK
jgi:hypothetical protein